MEWSISNQDERIAKYIFDILRLDLQKVFCWGFQNPRVIQNGLCASVSGFLYTGRIDIIYNGGKDLFEVRIYNNDGSLKDMVEDIYLDCLVNVIDNLIENCADYEERVSMAYGIH